MEFHANNEGKNDDNIGTTEYTENGTIREQTNFDKIKRVEEKIIATQKEFDIEMRIRDGLSKITKAKVTLLKRSKKTLDPDAAQLIETSKKKMDILKHELQKCQIQLSALHAAIAVDCNRKFPDAILASNLLSRPGSVSSPHIPGSVTTPRPSEVIKLTHLDPNTKTEVIKSFAVTDETSVRQLISRGIEKFVLDGVDDDYQLSYKSEQDDIPLRLDDPVMIPSIDFTQVTFTLTSKTEARAEGVLPVIKRNVSGSLLAMKEGARSVGSLIPTKDNRRKSLLLKFGMNSDDPVMVRKQREVFVELCETEHGYVESLRAIVTVFQEPLRLSGVMGADDISGIFSNIADILNLHEKISQKLEVGKDSVFLAMEAFEAEVNSFDKYLQYCANQSAARRLYNRLKTDASIQKLIAAYETDPKLKKLSLPDLLVKPMHRITRYPLLLKRLLSFTRPNSAEFDLINDLISKFEEKVLSINDNVRKTESLARINFIEENLEFNGKFKIADGKRELVSERNFTYIKKSTSGTLEVIVILFTDLLLIVRLKRADSFVLVKLPLPYESVVFLDKPDSPEIHQLQAPTVYDKNTWLQESESLRARFCNLYFEFELSRGHRFEDYNGAPISGSVDSDSGDDEYLKSTRVKKVSSQKLGTAMNLSNTMIGEASRSPPLLSRNSPSLPRSRSTSGGVYVRTAKQDKGEMQRRNSSEKETFEVFDGEWNGSHNPISSENLELETSGAPGTSPTSPLNMSSSTSQLSGRDAPVSRKKSSKTMGSAFFNQFTRGSSILHKADREAVSKSGTLVDSPAQSSVSATSTNSTGSSPGRVSPMEAVNWGSKILRKGSKTARLKRPATKAGTSTSQFEVATSGVEAISGSPLDFDSAFRSRSSSVKKEVDTPVSEGCK